MEMKFIAHWGWTSSNPKETPEEAIAVVPIGNTPYSVSAYPADVYLDHIYSLPSQRPIQGFHLAGNKA